MPDPLSAQQIQSALHDLPGWAYDERASKLTKRFAFGSFKEAMSFMVRIGFEAEALGHHPELHNVYDKVDISLSTHDADGRVTELDVKLAEAIESIAWTS
jgi:4a-hydroxytetrahydrobiopterin dehydratase